MGAGLQGPSLQSRVEALQQLLTDLQQRETLVDKLDYLDEMPLVEEFVDSHATVKTFLAGLNPECSLALKLVIAIGEGGCVFRTPDNLEAPFEKMRQLLGQLLDLEAFYRPIGGIVGYHLTILQLLIQGERFDVGSDVQERFLSPSGLDLSSPSPGVWSAMWAGLKGLCKVAELYPVGGAGDRLGLTDEQTAEALPAARLRFSGRTLLEGLIRDLQAREYLHYQVFGQQLVTPIAMMTSAEKNNTAHIQGICEENSWFGRPKESIQLFSQPLVPVLTNEGHWCMEAPLELRLKPGGHGVIWMLAKEKGILEWLQEKGRSKVLVRQINNPVADTDGGTLGFVGVGLKGGKDFGFASCRRLLHTAEGVNVLRERALSEGFVSSYSNIEYTEFKKYGIEEAAAGPGSPYSEYPANTNILFADLKAVEKAVEEMPIPGMLINMKSKVTYWDEKGESSLLPAGRLESTMQNLADTICDVRSEPIEPPSDQELRTYVTFNSRPKTISVTKKACVPGESKEETPEGCFATVQKNYRELLANFCNMQMPVLGQPDWSSQEEVPFVVQLHPALGPLYSMIAQKIRGGSMSRGSELQLEIACANIENLSLQGSLVVRAESPLGSHDKEGLLHYGNDGGKVWLKDVRVHNSGLDLKRSGKIWRNEVERETCLEIVLHGNGEFFAEGVTLSGNHRFEIPSGHRMKLVPKEMGFETVLESLSQPSWQWCYEWKEGEECRLEILEREES